MKYFILTIYRLTNGNYVSHLADNGHLYEIDRIFGDSEALPLTKEQASEAMEANGYKPAKATWRGENTVFEDIGGNGLETHVWHYMAISEIGTATDKAMRSIGWRKCDNCGEWVSPQDIRSGLSGWHRDEQKRLCRVCEAVWRLTQPKFINLGYYHENQENWRVINAEGEDFNLDNVKGVGLELEVNNAMHCRPRINGDRMASTDDFFKIADPEMDNQKKVFFCERDVTVAAEIISNTFSKKAFEEFDFSVLTDQARFVGNDESTPNVGLHFHISDTWLGETASERVASYLKVLYFVNAYQSDFEALSHRKVGGISDSEAFHWCSFASKSQILQMAKDANGHIAEGHDDWALSEFFVQHGSTGCAVIHSGKTIEFRIFHSTNDPVRIKQLGRFLMGLCEGLAKVSPSKCLALGKAFKYVPDDTKAWLRSQGLFLKSLAVAENGGRMGITSDELRFAGF